MRALRAAVGRATRWSTRSAWRRLQHDLEDPATAQAAVLQEVLRAGRDTAYGRRCRMGDISSVTAFQEAVPYIDHAGLAPWLERTAAGEPDVLVPGRPRFFERTSGSSGPAKWVPYTDLLLAQMRRGVHAWVHDLYRRDPALAAGQQYWAVSPVGSGPGATSGGIPIGVADDTQYMGRLSGWAFRRTLAVPPSVARLDDHARWQDETLRHLVRAADLRLVSVWSPSFLEVLLDRLRARPRPFLHDLPRRRRREAERASEDLPTLTHALWPRLRLLSAWTDGPSALLADRLHASLRHARLQGKGLLATEGLVTVPLEDVAAPVAVPSAHFYEFVPLDGTSSERPRLLHELKDGRRYSVVLTTGGGLYRYRLGDVVRCVGFCCATPMLRFEGRLHDTSDLVGEKLHERHVREVLAAVVPDARFAMLAPLLTPQAGYVLFIEDVDPASTLARQVEERLHENPQYAYARRLGQLAPVRVCAVENGLARYLEARRDRGDVLGAVKPPVLAIDPGIGERLMTEAAVVP